MADYPDQTEKMIDFLRSRLGDEPSEKETKRAIDALLRRGHSWNAIRQALKEVAQDADEFREE